MKAIDIRPAVINAMALPSKISGTSATAWTVALPLQVEIMDDGPGIPEPALQHIFDRFYRADPSRSRHTGGSGLGLAIVHAIVSAHGGNVTATNVHDNGARITVTLPRG